MRLTIIVAACLVLVALSGCAGLTGTLNDQEQFNGESVEHAVNFTLGPRIPDAKLAEFTADQIVALVEAYAKASIGLSTLETHFEFHQTNGAQSTAEGRQAAELRAQLAQQARDLVGGEGGAATGDTGNGQ